MPRSLPERGDRLRRQRARFPDALAGGPSAGASLGPLLLATPTSLPTTTKQQLLRLKPVRSFVLGGTSVVSYPVVNQVRQLFP